MLTGDAVSAGEFWNFICRLPPASYAPSCLFAAQALLPQCRVRVSAVAMHAFRRASLSFDILHVEKVRAMIFSLCARPAERVIAPARGRTAPPEASRPNEMKQRTDSASDGPRSLRSLQFVLCRRAAAAARG